MRNRREVITLIGGTTATWPFAACAKMTVKLSSLAAARPMKLD
jgi:hypothetical protein